MRTYEFRTYTLRNPESLRFYAGTVYPRHLESFPIFGVEAHGFWTSRDDDGPKLFALVSYAQDDDPAEVERRFLESEELAHDVRDFDVSNITNVESTILIPAPHSPLV